ncbi:electron transfer flavoprotein subunit alpha/FixB family protein [Dickeya fangzhongdai]|uniref:electron transfer flavoprotein subunit alpha/FixB family protein n=1 Tax=Dickeya fangzhongdai TaxID=1778540 RepID=UPI000690F7FA|nr:FAD-binding protein [Dickeya fangzhongdai]
MKILILAEHDNQSPVLSLRSLISAARQIGEQIDVLVAGYRCEGIAIQISQLAGVSRVCLADAPYYAVPGAENMALLLAMLAKGYTHVLTSSSVSARAILPRAAALLDIAPVSNVVRIVDARTFVRPVHTGNLLATVRNDEAIVMLGIQTGEMRNESTDEQPQAPIINVEAPPDCLLSFVEARILHDTEHPRLSTARVVVSGGRGFETADDFQRLLEPLAKELGAAIGATREIVDAGVPNEYQIGQSAHTVAPELYFAIGLSGASQHVCGMKGSKVVVVINRDERAPICQYADYVLIGNLYRQVPRLTQALHELSLRNRSVVTSDL